MTDRNQVCAKTNQPNHKDLYEFINLKSLTVCVGNRLHEQQTRNGYPVGRGTGGGGRHFVQLSVTAQST